MKCLISSELSQIRDAAETLREFGQEHQLDENISGQLELILVEALNNIIEHAYQGAAGHPIEVDFSLVSDEIIMTLQDEGTTAPDAVVNKTMPDEQSLPEGGWGLYLIQTLADRLEFSEKNGRNTMVIAKNIRP